ncbi:MAG: hypothetical protein AB200_02345 [Parcubacteria bacterium C7867-005]|nr:MAG: hypothetical protein AB200_02345 [Parcubacteria bacterium C7867-005]
MKSTNKKLISAILIASFLGPILMTPKLVMAQGTLLQIPVNNVPQTKKEVSQIPFFGIPIPGTSWDALGTLSLKILLRMATNDIVAWISGGTDGQPKFITNLEQYFKDAGDVIAGNIINDTELNGLCAPFRVQVKVNLARKYLTDNGKDGVNYNPQCTFMGVTNNLEGFLDDFNQGGWQGWLSMTQNDANNPDGNLIQLTNSIDKEVQKKLGIEKMLADWGRGFISIKDAKGNIKTPGSFINEQLTDVVGTGFRQLELADEFDEIVSAGIGLLAQKTLKNLAGAGRSPAGNQSGNQSAGATASPITCSADVSNTLVLNPVKWSAQVIGFNPEDSISYEWSGAGGLSGTQNTAEIIYTTEGVKDARVRVTRTRNIISVDESGLETIIPGVPETSTVICDPSVTVSKFPPLVVECYAEFPRYKRNEDVKWIANISGGSGEFELFPVRVDGAEIMVNALWGGTESQLPRTSIGVWPRYNAFNQTFERDPVTGITQVTITRQYVEDDERYFPGTKEAHISVVDLDRFVDPVDKKACKSIYVGH